jgi:hypothetical protein
MAPSNIKITTTIKTVPNILLLLLPANALVNLLCHTLLDTVGGRGQIVVIQHFNNGIANCLPKQTVIRRSDLSFTYAALVQPGACQTGRLHQIITIFGKTVTFGGVAFDLSCRAGYSLLLGNKCGNSVPHRKRIGERNGHRNRGYGFSRRPAPPC